MPQVEFRPSRQRVDVPSGTQLLDAARLAGVEIDAPCGGKGVCGRCIVRIAAGQVDFDSQGHLSNAAMAEGDVLACRTRLVNTDVVVEVPQRVGVEGGQFVEGDETHLIRHELLPRDFQFDPLAIKWRLAVPPAQREDGLSDLDRLARAIQRDWGRADVDCPLSVMRHLADTLRARDGRVTATLVREQATGPGGPGDAPPARLHVVRLEPGDTTTRHFGVAVDVGTTTVAVQLINLTDGRVLAVRSDYNDQIACGLDVLSRINYARRPDRLAELRGRALDTINRLVAQVAGSHDVDTREICNAVISGNTTMMHLLLGLKPEYIRLDPYTPTVLRWPVLTAAEIGLEINPDSWIALSPCVGSYVGGDITAGLLCTDLAGEPDEVSLFIDIGTNGELVLGNRDFLLTCACSAGPAFEGGGIDCGMRAALGAIEKVEVDPATGTPTCATIGGVRPRGICGSGMIDLLAKLFVTGWIDAAGKFDRTRPSPAIRIDGRKASYLLAPADLAEGGREIAITETDIENIIRAKAAIYSACALMLRHVEIEFSDLAHVYIAGGFGRFLDVENAVTLGLLPDIDRSRFRFVGNTSLMGSYMAAVSQAHRRRQHELAERMTYFDLSTEPSYMEQYTGALFLPHTDADRFPSVRVNPPPQSPPPQPGPPDEPTNKQKAVDEAIRRAADRLRSVDLPARCAMLGLAPPAGDGSVTVRLFGRELRIGGPDFQAAVAATGKPAKPVDRLLALHYLLCDRAVAPTGELISFRDLPGGQFYWASFQHRSVLPLAGAIGDDLARLRGNLDRFAWRPAGLGDVGAHVQAVGPLEMTLVYRAGDEEFPASAEIFFDSAIRGVFSTEDVAWIGQRICLGLL